MRRLPRRAGRDVSRVVQRLGDALVPVLLADAHLRTQRDGLVQPAAQDARVQALVAVAPLGRGGEAAVLGAQRLANVGEAALLAAPARRHGLVDPVEEVAQGVAVHGGLGEALRHDGWLLPLEAEAELDHGVDEPREEPLHHVPRGAGRVPRGAEERGDHGLPPAPVYLVLEEAQEVGVVGPAAEVLGRVGGPVGLQLGDDVWPRGRVLELVACVGVEGGLDGGLWGAGAVEREELVYELWGFVRSSRWHEVEGERNGGAVHGCEIRPR